MARQASQPGQRSRVATRSKTPTKPHAPAHVHSPTSSSNNSKQRTPDIMPNMDLLNKAWGFRAMISIFGNVPMLFLLTVTPYKAYLDGLIQFPNILISDAIGCCSQWHRSVYTCGISMTCISTIVIYSEMIREIKLRINNLKPAVKKNLDPLFLVALDQFLFIIFLVVLPNLLLLVSFMFIEDTDEDLKAGWSAPTEGPGERRERKP